MKKLTLPKSERGWKYERVVPEGRHRYKFLINGELEINDPYAEDYELDADGNVWSVLDINEKEKDNREYSLRIDDYVLFSRNLEEDEKIPENKKIYTLGTDDMVSARFGFTEVRGVHEVEVLWYMPDGRLYSYGTEALCGNESEENEEIYGNSSSNDKSEKKMYMWFYVPFEKVNRIEAEGTWRVKLVIDGNYVLEDTFKVQNGISYGRYANLSVYK